MNNQRITKEGGYEEGQCQNRNVVQDEKEVNQTGIRILENPKSEENPSGDCGEHHDEHEIDCKPRKPI